MVWLKFKDPYFYNPCMCSFDTCTVVDVGPKFYIIYLFYSTDLIMFSDLEAKVMDIC